ncbi:vitamin K epoxide reductase family protein [Chitinophaga sp. HK235]|uniref:vitamin K epoxide reductase family protein n=1 Tax=Chitinophaga sp. HK235 TaxID=2952571 RepID=UPI001BA91323|nr:vitamin K epoxide reductase family protein [Chitinophaga sp. HK235]
MLKSLHVNFTDNGLSEALENHVDYPSLLSLKDTIFGYGIESAAIEKGQHSYEEFETPFICSVQQEGWPVAHFIIVTDAADGHITYLDPVTDKPQQITVGEFEKIDKHIILLLDTSAARHEAGFAENRKRQQRDYLVKRIPVWLALAAILFSAGYMLTHPAGTPTWCGIGFLLTSFFGLAVSSLLIWNEIDAHNPFIKEVCGGNSKKVSCNAVLSSSGASFMGVNWSVWGFAFFAAFFTAQVLFPGNTSLMLIWSALSLVAAPYILFSVYYQWRVIKQWCPLCLAVQVVLGLNALIAGTYLSDSPVFLDGIEWYHIVITLLTGIIFLFLTSFIIPELRNARDSRSYEKKWKNLRYNPEIFQALLDKSDKITIPPDDLGILVGNPDASTEIIKVCNPYCGPCSRAHPELEQIINNNPDIKLRIIFTASGEDSDEKSAPVAHLLAIQQKFGREKVHHALDDWYLASKKDYTAFAGKYPMNGELKEQKEKMAAMRNWCNVMKIRATPTIFINGSELPDGYRVNELKNFF